MHLQQADYAWIHLCNTAAYTLRCNLASGTTAALLRTVFQAWIQGWPQRAQPAARTRCLLPEHAGPHPPEPPRQPRGASRAWQHPQGTAAEPSRPCPVRGGSAGARPGRPPWLPICRPAPAKIHSLLISDHAGHLEIAAACPRAAGLTRLSQPTSCQQHCCPMNFAEDPPDPPDPSAGSCDMVINAARESVCLWVSEHHKHA